jgi:hypothetical protein
MPANLHNRPFDEGTIIKLRIFELYARGWIPVFLSADLRLKIGELVSKFELPSPTTLLTKDGNRNGFSVVIR